MSAAELLGAFQRPVLNQDPSIAAIAGTATLTLVSTTAPNTGTLYAIVQSSTSVAATLSGGSNTATGTGTALVLSCAVSAGQTVTLTANANSGPVSRIAGNVTLIVAANVSLADLASIFTAAGQLIVGTGAGSLELLNKGAANSVLSVGGADPSGLQWVALSTLGVTSFNTRTGAVTSQLSDVTGLFGAKGQLLAGTGVGTGALKTVGANGTVLAADSSKSDGLDWVTLAAGGVTSFNTRTGAVTSQLSDVTGLFGAAGQLLVGTGVGTGELLAKGSANQYLQVSGADPSGLQWVTITAPSPAFSGCRVYNTGTGQTIGAGVTANLTFDTEVFDVGGWHDAINTDRFTAPAAGYVQFDAIISILRGTALADTFIRPTLNGTTLFDYLCPRPPAVSQRVSYTLSFVVSMAIADIVRFSVTNSDTGTITIDGNGTLIKNPVVCVAYLGT